MNDVSLDRTTGRLKIISRGWEFGPELHLTEFQASEAAILAKQISKTANQYQIRVGLACGWFCNLILTFNGDHCQDTARIFRAGA